MTWQSVKVLLLAIEQRSAREKRVCFNCLRSSHFTPKCPSKSRYVRCRRSHHSLLYPEEDRTAKTIANQVPGSETTVPSTSSITESAVVTHVQSVQAKIPCAECGTLSTTWADLHSTDG
jgi:hypothetical protein